MLCSVPGMLLAAQGALPKPLILIALCFSSAAVLATDPKGKPALSEFDGMDANRDGRISAAEHAAGARKMFRAMDANRDGKVTAGEMDAAYTKVTGKKADDLSAAEKIKLVDRDGDGVLTASEHDAAVKEMFRKMDADRDGYLSKDEWAAGHAALMKKAQK
jgi:Ca2+-binding EF-hand superfamily protein